MKCDCSRAKEGVENEQNESAFNVRFAHSFITLAAAFVYYAEIHSYAYSDIQSFIPNTNRHSKSHPRKNPQQFEITMLIFIAIIATIGQALTTTQRSLTADVSTEFPIFIQFEGQTHSIDVPSDGTIKDIESALSRMTQMDNAQFLLRFRGQILYDYSVPIADTGIFAESLVEAVLMNDLQIFLQMVKSEHREFEVVDDSVTHGQFKSHWSFIAMEGGRIIELRLALERISVNELWRLKGLTKLHKLVLINSGSSLSQLDLSGLSYLKNLDWLAFVALRGCQELILPNWEESKLTMISIMACPDLKRIDVRSLGYRSGDFTILGGKRIEIIC